jgi:hypothetical protein
MVDGYLLSPRGQGAHGPSTACGMLPKSRGGELRGPTSFDMTVTEVVSAMQSLPLVGHAELERIPASSGVYSAWLSGEDRCLYVGQADKSQGRIRAHFAGQRGCDQFCLYVYDRYIHPVRGEGLTTVQVNRKTRDWIRERVRFCWVSAPSSELDALERELRKKLQPILNPLSSQDATGEPTAVRRPEEPGARR